MNLRGELLCAFVLLLVTACGPRLAADEAVSLDLAIESVRMVVDVDDECASVEARAGLSDHHAHLLTLLDALRDSLNKPATWSSFWSSFVDSFLGEPSPHGSLQPGDDAGEGAP